MAEVKDKLVTVDGLKEVHDNVINNISNPNLLINSNFMKVVNQRGSTIYNSLDWNHKVYSVDRWCIIGGGNNDTKVTVNSNSITLSSVNEGGNFRQYFENVLNGKYTLTIKVKSLTGNAQIHDSAEDLAFLQVGKNIVTFEHEFSYVGINVDKNTSIEIEYIKLEKGSMATPYSPKPYAEELIACKQYYTEISTTSHIHYDYGSNKYGLVVTLPKMRKFLITPNSTIPNITYNYAHSYDTSGIGITSTSYSVLNMGEEMDTIIQYTFPRALRLSSRYVCGVLIVMRLDAEIY